MRETSPPSPAVVVGIDGSRGAVDAALWAIDEAVERDLPLRLVYAIEPRKSGRSDSDSVAYDFTTAEIAIRQTKMAIESMDKPVKIEVEIVQKQAASALVAASHSAAMLCVGALGINRASGRRVGSTVSALLDRTHCPIAVIRQPAAFSVGPGWVVAQLDRPSDSSPVLGHAFDEARLRDTSLHVLTSWRPAFPDITDGCTSTESIRQTKANLERTLARYRRLYPDVVVQAVAVRGSPLDYLKRHSESIQLIVLSHPPSNELSELAGPAACAALNGVNCSVLISERHGAL